MPKPRVFKYPKCPICKHHHKVPDETKGESKLAYCWLRGVASVMKPSECEKLGVPAWEVD